MKLFSKEDNVQYWIILFMEEDPSLQPIIKNAEFQKYLKETKARFWKMHEALKTFLDDKGLL
jgi:hypothetical protein